MPVIAVEDGLSNVRRALEEAGFEVTGMSPKDLKRAQAVVVSGLDSNVLQQQDIVTDVPVIDARALSAEEVIEDIKSRLPVNFGSC